MTTIVRRYQMSHPAFARICSRLDIPRPERGYWAKRQAGKRVRWAPLPARRPGQAKYLGLGDVNYENLGRVIPETPPAFPDDLDLIEQSVKRSLGLSIARVMPGGIATVMPVSRSGEGGVDGQGMGASGEAGRGASLAR